MNFGDELDQLAAAGRRRDLDAIDARTGGVDFASNDYLGLSRHPAVVAAAHRALDEHGAGGRAARLLGGGAANDLLERTVAEWLDTESALAFPSGYQANVGLLTALAGPGDAIVLDELAHASLIDGARMSRARVLVHAHGCARDLEARLAEARGARRRLVVTEGVFSMDGDRVDLAAFDAVCRREDALLIVDEAHAIGVVGTAGRGAWSDTDGEGSCIRIITGGKALGVSGGLVACDRTVRDVLVHRARSFMFTTATAPATTAALIAAIEVCREADDRRRALRANAARVATGLDLPEPAAAIVPWRTGSEASALAAEAASRDAGYDVRCVRPPTVAPNSCRLRIVARSEQTPDQLEGLVTCLRSIEREPIEVRTRPRAKCTFVIGTDTGIGKTVISAKLMRARSEALYWKPVQTGDDSDTATVAALAELEPGRLAAPSFELPLPASPHAAAADAGVSIRLDDLRERLAVLRESHDEVIVELAGGLMVPYGDGHLQIDWLALERPEIVLVARAGLGTLNHTLLSVAALAERRLEPTAVYLVGDPHASNFETLTAMLDCEVHEVPWFDPLTPEHLDG